MAAARPPRVPGRLASRTNVAWIFRASIGRVARNARHDWPVPKASMQTRTPRRSSAARVSRARSGSRTRHSSPISSLRSAPSRHEARSAPSTESTKSDAANCWATTPTETGRRGRPPSCQSPAWEQASRSSQLPTWTVSSLSPASGARPPGPTAPRPGCRQRTRAEAPTSTPVALSTAGSNSRPRAPWSRAARSAPSRDRCSRERVFISFAWKRCPPPAPARASSRAASALRTRLSGSEPSAG